MSKPKLSNDDYCRASKRLKCEVAAIKAVAQVESAGNGFYDDGFPVILFERHLFRKFTQGRYNQQYPEISGSQGNYGAAAANQRRKFSLAFSLNPSAAMRACSWGKFQILGDNFRVCGYTSVDAFVDAMKESEGKHLDAFVGFVMGNALTQHLRDKDWASFARGYNGKNYRINNYDGKMANAYAKFKRENIDCSQVSVASPARLDSEPSESKDATTYQQSPLDDATPKPPSPEVIAGATQSAVSTETTTTETTGTPPGDTTQTTTTTNSSDPVGVVPAKPGLWTTIIAFFTMIYGYYKLAKENFGDLVDKATDAIDIHFILNAAVGAGLVVLGIWLYDRSRQRAVGVTNNLIANAADQTTNTVVLVKPVHWWSRFV